MISAAGSSDYASYYLSLLNQTRQTDQTQSKNSESEQSESTDSLRMGAGFFQNDELTLSEDGLRMSEKVGQSQRPQGPPPGGGPKEAGGSESNGFAERLEEEEEAFNEKLMAKLAEAGVETDQEIELGYDEDGNIVVTSDMDAEEKALIESVLEDAELAESYAELTEMRAQAAKMEAEGPPSGMPRMQGGSPPGWMANGQIANVSNVASMYASHSSISSNTIAVQSTQTVT